MTINTASRTSFALVPGWVIDRVPDAIDLRIYTHLAWKHSDKDRYCFPSEETIAKDLGYGVRTVQRAVQRMRDAGVLRVVRSRKPDGHWGHNGYVLPMDDPFDGDMHPHDPPPQAADHPPPQAADHPPPQAADHPPPQAGREPDPLKQPDPGFNNLENPDGFSSSATPDGATDLDPHDDDRDLLGQPVSRPVGETRPRSDAGLSSKRVAGGGAVRGGKSADDLVAREDVEQLCHRLQARMIENGFKPPTITKRWRDDARYLLDTDARDLTKALNLLDWCQRHTFWKTNIRSPGKFRAQYDTLRLQAIEDHNRRNGQSASDGRGGSRRNFEDIPDAVWAAPLA